MVSFKISLPEENRAENSCAAAKYVTRFRYASYDDLYRVR